MFPNYVVLKCIINLDYFYFIFSISPPPSQRIIYFHPLNSSLQPFTTWREKTQPQPQTKRICPNSQSLFTLMLPGKRQCLIVMRGAAVHNIACGIKILNLLKRHFPDSFRMSGKCKSQIFCIILHTIIILSKMGNGG